MAKKYAIVGVGSRSHMYSQALLDKYAGHSRLVAVCDTNPGRLNLALSKCAEAGAETKGYPADEFEKMIRETQPDAVIVTTVDRYHDDYICKAMEMGCDTITEKPMTISEQKCQRIINTCRKTNRDCRVTFNYRYSPPRTQIKELLMSGVIGDVLSVDFNWLLNTRHGADYFRRWHRNKENSGGLLVHKATHHFDLINWWLDTTPQSVHALGKRNFYLPETAERYGLSNRSERCSQCPELKNCRFALDMNSKETLRKLYLETEHFDGYFRDKCVFGKDIDIEDTMHLIVSYKNGATMSYSLNAFMPWEGLQIAINGSKGRIEHICRETVYVSGDGNVPGKLIKESTKTKVYPHFETAYEVDVWSGSGGHGGGDPALLEDLFSESPPQDKYMRASDYRGGAWSILTGIAGNHSIDENRTVQIDELISGLDEPDYPAPSPQD